MLYQVKDLSPEQKQAAEILLGHPVSDDEVVSIKSLGPSTIIRSKLSPEERIEALRALNERFARGYTLTSAKTRRRRWPTRRYAQPAPITGQSFENCS